jgi:hypothetical protein
VSGQYRREATFSVYAALPLIAGMLLFSFRSRRVQILIQMNSRITSSTKALNKTNPKTTHAVIIATTPPWLMLLVAWKIGRAPRVRHWIGLLTET